MRKTVSLWFASVLLLGFGSIAITGESTTDQNGTAHRPDALTGKVTIVDFAASWCKPCWKALPHLQQFADRHPEVRVLVVSEDDSRKGRDRLVKKLGLRVPVIWDANHIWAEKFQPPGMPTTFVLDAQGKVVHRQVGFDEKKWAKTRKVLAELSESASP